MNDNRRRAHIRRGERVFIPQWRMRQVRWEEAVLNRSFKNSRRNKSDYNLIHWDCSCGSLGCIANPMVLRK